MFSSACQWIRQFVSLHGVYCMRARLMKNARCSRLHTNGKGSEPALQLAAWALELNCTRQKITVTHTWLSKEYFQDQDVRRTKYTTVNVDRAPENRGSRNTPDLKNHSINQAITASLPCCAARQHARIPPVLPYFHFVCPTPGTGGGRGPSLDWMDSTALCRRPEKTCSRWIATCCRMFFKTVVFRHNFLKTLHICQESQKASFHLLCAQKVLQ